jgi:hypothetical protein
MLRDSATHDDRLLSLRTLKNYAISYDDGRLKVRNGYTRWNDTQLAAVAKQLFWFSDLSQNEHLIGLVNNFWYKIAESGAHTQLSTASSTARRPIIQVNNRVMFGTDAANDTGFKWSDDTAIGAGASYNVGITRPNEGPSAVPTAVIGHSVAVTGTTLNLNVTDQQKIGVQFVLTTTMSIGSMSVSVMRPGPIAMPGNVRIQIYTNNAGEPSTTRVDDNAISNWFPVAFMPVKGAVALADTLKLFTFRNAFNLAAGTYWAVVEKDSGYDDNFSEVGGSLAYCELGNDAPGAPDFAFAQVWDGAAWTGTAKEVYFQMGGLDDSKFYDYVITYQNSTYGIESRQSDHIRVDPTATEPTMTLALPTSNDGQVDIVRVYRREVENIDDPEADVTDTYKYVDESTEGASIIDTIPTANLGAELQTQDHYRFDETDDSNQQLRDAALLPNVAVHWKGRVWFAEANGNILHFSKILEKDGATGLTGDSIPDYFPLDNRLEIGETSDIIALLALSADELAVYFRNTSVWVMRGSDDVLNPPADIVLRQMVTDVGLIAPAAVDSLRSRHVFVARKGVYTFTGTSAIEYVSGGIQTILDEIADSSLDDSVVVALGDSIWMAVDEDETADGKLNNIYILDIQRQPATWRLYNYAGISIYDMVVRKTGTEYKTLLAADADNNFILKLEDGNSDNGEAIVAEAETQDLVAPNLATIFEISIDAFYPNVPPVYEGQVTDAKGETHDFELTPVAIDDIAGHKAYPIIPSAIGSRINIIQRTVNQNHLRAIDIGYVEL